MGAMQMELWRARCKRILDAVAIPWAVGTGRSRRLMLGGTWANAAAGGTNGPRGGFHMGFVFLPRLARE